jgi:hypothetical protein
VSAWGYPATPFANKRDGNPKKPTKIVLRRTITYIFVTGVDKLKTSSILVSISNLVVNFQAAYQALFLLLVAAFFSHSSAFVPRFLTGEPS